VRLLVQAIDGRLRFGVGAHFHESKPFASTRVAVHHHLGIGDCPVLREELLQILVCHLVADVSDIQSLTHRRPSSGVPMDAGLKQIV
jgi:hypothetical protein